jgi:DNA primase
MKLPNDFFETIRASIVVSSVVRQRVALTKRGVEYTGLCPFHSEKSPSFTVNDIKRFYHCFGCGAHGDVIRFVSETSGLKPKEAAIKLAEENGIEVPKLSKAEEKLYEEIDQIHHILNLAAEFFHKNLNEKTISYLKSRDIKDATVNAFFLGYAPNDKSLTKYLEKHKIPLMMMNKAGLVSKGEDDKVYEVFRDRLMFPIKNIYGKVIGFGGRTMSDANPKYLNSPETIVFKKNETLYGEDKAMAESYRQGSMIVVEGYMDVIALQKNGFENVVASLGTAVTNNHITKLWRSCDEIIMCLDGDEAGIKASQKVVDLSITQVNHNKSISFILLPNKQDPDDILQKTLLF